MAKSRRKRARRGAGASVPSEAALVAGAAGPQAGTQAAGAERRGGLAALWAALPWAGLLLLVAGVYWPVLLAGFVWDDKVFILESAQIREWAGLTNIWLDPARSNELHYWPLLNTSFWLDHKLWGFNPAGFHATNLALHGVNTLLVWRLLAWLGVPGAWLVAAFFALHPVHAEPVAWVTARKDLLATCFYLLAFGAWLRYRERLAFEGDSRGLAAANSRERSPSGSGLFRASSGGRSPSHSGLFMASRLWHSPAGLYLLLLALYIAALLSKTVAITLPAALLVWCWWRQGRITRQDWLQTAPLFALGLAIGLYGLDYYGGRAHIGFEHSFAERLIIASKALWFYAGKLLWPHPLLVIYPHWDTDPLRLANWLVLPAALALAAALWLARARIGRGPLAGVLFFAITLAPMLGFADNSYMKFSFAADRYQYLASLGLLAVVVGALVGACHRVADRYVKGTPTGDPAGAALGSPSSLTSRGRWGSDSGAAAQRYHSPPEGEFANATSVGGGGSQSQPHPWTQWQNQHIAPLRNPALIACLALAALLLTTCALLTRQQLRLFHDEAALFRHVVATNPAAPRAWPSLGGALMHQQPEEAVQAFRKALELEPDDTHTHVRLSRTLMNLQRYDEALALIESALARGLDDYAGVNTPLRKSHLGAKLPYNLGLTLLKLERPKDAEAAFRRVLQLEPGNLQALHSLTGALRDQARHAEALALLQAAADALPKPSADLYLRMAEIAAEQGRTKAAEAYNRQALAANPQSLAALRPYAATHFNAKRYAEALAAYRQLAALAPKDVGAQIGQALALAALGRLPEAQQAYERALALDPSHPQALGELALIHYQAARYREALPLFQRLASQSPDDAEAQVNLGAVQAQLGDWPAAALSFARAQTLRPDDPSIQAYLTQARQHLAPN